MTPKQSALDLIQRGYYGSEMDIEELMAELQHAIGQINECHCEPESEETK